MLRTKPKEVQALLRDLLIGVTNFFRDTAAWQALQAIIPDLFVGKGAGAQVHVWVAGCASGEVCMLKTATRRTDIASQAIQAPAAGDSQPASASVPACSWWTEW